MMTDTTGLEIAIIGMACRFPGAPSLDEFWALLRDGREAITFFSDAELQAAGVPAERYTNPSAIKASGILPAVDMFDAAFFGITPREACLTDPQHRLFLECAWEALEHAGYAPGDTPRSIGVFGGTGLNNYQHLLGTRYFAADADDYARLIGNAPDFLASRVAYKLNLRGPTIVVQTACSTGLVAVHLAVQSLIAGECDMALAGASSVRVPQVTAYLHQEGSILSPDGRCRPFDHQARGTVIASGVGMVVLKRLDDALNDGDTIAAVIKGSAMNNDGAARVGYTAPGVEGQTQVIRTAYQVADVHADTVSYIEAHGTGTALGDPIEVTALTQAFRAHTSRTQFCALGSVKSNIGHTDATAGVAGLIKTVLALQARQIPPTLHFTRPNPGMDMDRSPFFVAATSQVWNSGDTPRRAGVSAFGLGGTNVHVVLEEAPPAPPPEPTRPWHILPLSARTPTALETATTNLTHYLAHQTDATTNTSNLADVAYTLQVGRTARPCRRVVIGEHGQAVGEALKTADPVRVLSGTVKGSTPGVVFLFPGGGAQYVGMGQGLYTHEPVFRDTIDQGAALLHPLLAHDIRKVLYSSTNGSPDTGPTLRQIDRALPALFLTEYALAQLWMSWGVQPVAMIGHSMGEYTAACLSGVMTFADALALVVRRGQLFATLPRGAMLSVALPEAQMRPLLNENLSIAAVNVPDQCVVSGTVAAIDQLAAHCQSQGIECRRLAIDIAAHSPMIDPILEPFAQCIKRISLHPPRIPFLSNVNGTWIDAQEVTTPQYWTRHLRQTVAFQSSVQTLLQEEHVFLEVGPGRTLSSYVRRHPQRTTRHPCITSLPHPDDSLPDMATMARALGSLWLAGCSVNWGAVHAPSQRHRISLPTYPFERQRYWVANPDTSDAYGGAVRGQLILDAPEDNLLSSDLDSAFPATVASPQTPTEHMLARIWQHLLGYTAIGIHDNFFDLGGDSLLAVQLVAQVRQATGVQLPLRRMVQCPTIAGLAAAIAEDSSINMLAAATENLVPFRPDGELPALFLIHPVGGGVFGYTELVQQLALSRQVWGIQAQGFADGQEPIQSIPEIARTYLEQVQHVQPAGPYLLVGHSFGGAVAFEMAQQLYDRNQEVGLVALLDTPDPAIHIVDDTAAILVSLFSSSQEEAIALLDTLRPMSTSEQWEYVREQARHVSLDMEMLQRLFRLVQAHVIALHAYVPRSYAGDVVYVRAITRDCLNPPGAERRWCSVVHSMTVREAPGDHETMLRLPHVQSLAALLREYV